jgi:hypothetical protein
MIRSLANDNVFHACCSESSDVADLPLFGVKSLHDTQVLVSEHTELVT